MHLAKDYLTDMTWYQIFSLWHQIIQIKLNPSAVNVQLHTKREVLKA